MEYNKIIIHAGMSALIGLVLALFYGLFDYILQWLWTGPGMYNVSLSTLIGGQRITLILLMLIMAGVAVAIYYTRYVDGNYVFAGAFFGLIAGIVLGTMTGIMLLLDTIFLSAGLDALQYAGEALTILSQPKYPIIVCVLAFISSICAYGYLYLLKRPSSDKIIDKEQIEKEDRIAVVGITAFILAVVLLPQIFTYIRVSIGL